MDVKQQGALATYVANEIVVKGKKLKGDSFEVKGIGKVKVEPNSFKDMIMRQKGMELSYYQNELYLRKIILISIIFSRNVRIYRTFLFLH